MYRMYRYNLIFGRPWYYGTRAQGLEAPPQWSDVYVFSAPPVPGITFTLPILNEDRTAYVGVAAADVALQSIR